MRMTYCEYARRLRTDGVNVEYIREYAAYRSSFKDFKNGNVRSRIVIGPNGIGKSRLYRQAGKGGFYVKARLTPAMLYEQAYLFRDKKIVIDDVDGMLGEKTFVSILKALMERERVRLIMWYTQNSRFERDGIPLEFHTTSPVAILLNRVPDKPNSDLTACLSRSSVILFDPTPEEVHEYVGGWFEKVMGKENLDVYNFVGENLSVAINLSCRTYDLLVERKKCGGDYTLLAENLWAAAELNDTEAYRSKMLALIGTLMVKYKEPKDRRKEFIKTTGYKPDAFFSWLREWKKVQGLNNQPKVPNLPTPPKEQPDNPAPPAEQPLSPIRLPPPPKPNHDRTFD